MVKPILSAICHGMSMSSSTSSSTHVKPSHNNQPTAQDSLLPPIVINTRPVERAAPLTQYLQAAQLTVVEMPMLALQSRPTTEQDMVLMRQWLAGDYKALVIVSPTAAASGLAVWQALISEQSAQDSIDSHRYTETKEVKAPSHLIAVGEATAAVLNDAKIQPASYQVRQPKVANNEGMLAMPEIESLQAGDKLLVWRGLGGRRLLVDTLQARGVHIDSIAWYERTMPVDAMAQYQQWLQGFLTQDIAPSKQSKPIVVVSSGTAFEHWESVVKTVAEQALEKNLDSDMLSSVALKLTDFAYVVLGERLANIVAEQQLSYWRVEDLAPETILAAISAKPYNAKT
ncbi:uroporphyrinogen-III synthase [Psychrobacter sp. FME5]|uniref:uroporphyrinogen-III synthase n=1 Tax=Psychrobacter sp. FME5 TaxID=2487706 RepID=UPI001CE4A10C|nr:uroporphyrinogen-III synthase [Psychrobacter sp. FME5]